jgi:hypothetical protein
MSIHVIACDKREAFAQGSEATKQSIAPRKGKNASLSPYPPLEGEGWRVAMNVMQTQCCVRAGVG